MTYKTSLVGAIESTSDTYDASCKRILAEKQVLARILHDYLYEYADTEIDAIVNKYIEGDPRVACEPVSRDDRAAERITGLSTADSTVAEGRVDFDIRFDAIVPRTHDVVRIEVDLEAQNSFNPGYPLTRRAIYYCGRLLSIQGEELVRKSHYERLRKVVSIWVCTHPSMEYAGTVTRFALRPENLVGAAHFDFSTFDLIEVIMICLDPRRQSKEDGALGLLSKLMLSSEDSSRKIEELRDEFGMMVSEEFAGEVRNMSNLAEGVWAEGFEQGIEEGTERGHRSATLHSIENLMASLSMDPERAMDVLRIPEDERALYRKLLEA